MMTDVSDFRCEHVHKDAPNGSICEDCYAQETGFSSSGLRPESFSGREGSNPLESRPASQLLKSTNNDKNSNDDAETEEILMDIELDFRDEDGKCHLEEHYRNYPDDPIKNLIKKTIKLAREKERAKWEGSFRELINKRDAKEVIDSLLETKRNIKKEAYAEVFKEIDGYMQSDKSVAIWNKEYKKIKKEFGVA